MAIPGEGGLPGPSEALAASGKYPRSFLGDHALAYQLFAPMHRLFAPIPSLHPTQNHKAVFYFACHAQRRFVPLWLMLPVPIYARNSPTNTLICGVCRRVKPPDKPGVWVWARIQPPADVPIFNEQAEGPCNSGKHGRVRCWLVRRRSGEKRALTWKFREGALP